MEAPGESQEGARPAAWGYRRVGKNWHVDGFSGERVCTEAAREVQHVEGRNSPGTEKGQSEK